MPNAMNLATTSDSIRQVLSDSDALHRIHLILDGQEWDSDTAAAIAEVLLETGREITEVDECELSRNELIERLREDMTNGIVANGSEALNPLLNNGFRGLENMPYSQLLALARDANILDTDGEEED